MNKRRRFKAKARRRVNWLDQMKKAIYIKSGWTQMRRWEMNHDRLSLLPCNLRY